MTTTSALSTLLGQDLKIVDCDAHFTEPADLWSSRVPASMQDRMPVQKTVDGRTGWFLDDEMWASIGGNTIRTGREKVLGSHVVQPFADIDPAAWSVPDRLALHGRHGHPRPDPLPERDRVRVEPRLRHQGRGGSARWSSRPTTTSSSTSSTTPTAGSCRKRSCRSGTWTSPSRR